jgi:hypothetical protein
MQLARPIFCDKFKKKKNLLSEGSNTLIDYNFHTKWQNVKFFFGNDVYLLLGIYQGFESWGMSIGVV